MLSTIYIYIYTQYIHVHMNTYPHTALQLIHLIFQTWPFSNIKTFGFYRKFRWSDTDLSSGRRPRGAKKTPRASLCLVSERYTSAESKCLAKTGRFFTTRFIKNLCQFIYFPGKNEWNMVKHISKFGLLKPDFGFGFQLFILRVQAEKSWIFSFSGNWREDVCRLDVFNQMVLKLLRKEYSL